MVIGSSTSSMAASTIAKSGTVPFRTAASPESIDCSPQVMSEKGITIPRSATTTRCRYGDQLRGIDWRLMAVTTTSTAAPIARRAATRVNGVSVSTPILMNR